MNFIYVIIFICICASRCVKFCLALFSRKWTMKFGACRYACTWKVTRVKWTELHNWFPRKRDLVSKIVILHFRLVFTRKIISFLSVLQFSVYPVYVTIEIETSILNGLTLKFLKIVMFLAAYVYYRRFSSSSELYLAYSFQVEINNTKVNSVFPIDSYDVSHQRDLLYPRINHPFRIFTPSNTPRQYFNRNTYIPFQRFFEIHLWMSFQEILKSITYFLLTLNRATFRSLPIVNMKL